MGGVRVEMKLTEGRHLFYVPLQDVPLATPKKTALRDARAAPQASPAPGQVQKTSTSEAQHVPQTGGGGARACRRDVL